MSILSVSGALALLRRRGHHIIFGLALLSMAALCTWWAVFINKAILRERQIHYSNLQFRIRAYGFSLGHDPMKPPPLGILEKDEQLEIIKGRAGGNPLAFELAPHWPDYVLRPRREVIAAIDRRFRRRRLMVIGEGSFLGLLVLLSIAMLYRLIQVERRAGQEMREFWRRITHEIKTPITALKAFLQTLKTQELSRAELTPLVDLALKQVERQQQLAQNILIGQRISRDALQLHPVPVNLAEFLENYFSSHALVLTGQSVDLELPPNGPLWVNADPESLHVILDNLVDNALKYAGEKLQLRVIVSLNGENARITVADNGPGFDNRLADNLFDAYRRLNTELPEGKHGTGIGLHISRELARQMGGDLTASCPGPGQGARFHIELKLASGQPRRGA
jgi:signal transduction histidine kinase